MASPAFTKQFLAIREGLFGFILALVRDFDVAEDLFQEVSVRVLEREHQFRPGTNFGAWVREFARRAVLEHARHSSRVKLGPEAIEAVSSRYCMSETVGAGLQKALSDCLAKLAPQARLLIELRYERGLGIPDIACEVERRTGTVQVSLSRVRQWLLKCMRREAPGALPL